MAKLKNLVFVERGADGGKFEMTVPCKVDPKSGLFMGMVPEEFRKQVADMKDQGLLGDARAISTTWCHERGDINHYVVSDTLANLEARIRQVIKANLETTVTTEWVIAYAMESTCHYWQLPDGTILTNGGGARDQGYWAKDARHPGDGVGAPYSIGLYVRLRAKETHVNRAGTETVKYVPPKTEYGTQARRLTEWVHMHEAKYAPAAIEIPYTEEAAEFFNNMIEGLCKMSQVMHGFFKDHEKVQQAIENKSGVFPRIGYSGV